MHTVVNTAIKVMMLRILIKLDTNTAGGGTEEAVKVSVFIPEWTTRHH